MTSSSDFYTAFRGRFVSLLRWEDLAAFWDVLRARAGAGWYLYAVGEPVPKHPSTAEEVERFIAAVDALLHRDHREDYCGIVYTDSRENPTLVKIFDPQNLGVACGFSTNPPKPGWVMSLIPPEPLEDRRPLPEARRRWWRSLWR